MRRCLSVLLSVLMIAALFSIAPVTVGAEGNSGIILFGDLDYDKAITQADTDLITDYITGTASFTDGQMVLADLNTDGLINITDLSLAAKMCNGSSPYVYLMSYGYCGENVKFILKQNKELIIFGEGDMHNYTKGDSVEYSSNIPNKPFLYTPWHEYKNIALSVKICSGVNAIGELAFVDMTLESISISDSVTKIRRGAFSYCKELEEIYIPSYVNVIGDECFYKCSDLKRIVVDDENTIFSSYNGALYNYSKTSLLSYPAGAKESQFVIPSSVKEISRSSLSYCNNLTSVIIPNSVTNIAYCAFEFCQNITSIIIPNSVSTIGNNAFSHCDGLSNVSFGSGVKNIGSYSFCYCNNLKSVTIPNSVTGIGERAFGYYYSHTDNTHSIVEGFTISGYSGSAAERYANDNGITFIDIESNNPNPNPPDPFEDETETTKALEDNQNPEKDPVINPVDDVPIEYETDPPAEDTTSEQPTTLDWNWDEPTDAPEETTSAYEETTEPPTVSAEPSEETTITPTATTEVYEDTTVAPTAATDTVTNTSAVDVEVFKFLPNTSQKDCTVKLVIKDTNGQFYTYDFITTPEIYDGINVLSAEVQMDYTPALIQYQMYKDDIWQDQVTLNSDQIETAKNEIITGDGGIFEGTRPSEKPITKNTETTVLQVSTWTQSTTAVPERTTAALITQTQAATEKRTVTPAKTAVQISQTITAKSYKKLYGQKPFYLNAKSSGGTKLSYKTSNNKVATVNSSGKVTIKGCGKATITITAASSTLYDSASKKITVTVKPGKIKYTTRDRTTKKGIRIVKVNFKPQKNCDGYQVQISLKNSFKDIKSAKLKKTKKTVMFKKVSIGTKYYLRLRAYKKIGGKKTYGRWSKTSFIA